MFMNMSNDIFPLFYVYGYWIIFFGLMANGAGLPVPGEIYLLLGGVAAGSGKFDFITAIPISVAGAVIGDSIAFYIGRSGGRRLLDLYCKYTLSTAKCSDRITFFYKRFGAGAIPLTRYIPGIRLLMAPMAGVSRITFSRFFILDVIGAASWIVIYLLIGYVFQEIIFDIISILEKARYGAILIAAAVIGIILFKILKRRFAGKPDIKNIIQTKQPDLPC